MTKATRSFLVPVACLLVWSALLTSGTAAGQDWPSWRGHGQNGGLDQASLVSSWSKDGENLIWSDQWIGRSTPAGVRRARLRERTHGRRGLETGDRRLLNAADGTKLWEHKFSVANTTVPFNRVGWGSGHRRFPRPGTCTP